MDVVAEAGDVPRRSASCWVTSRALPPARWGQYCGPMRLEASPVDALTDEPLSIRLAEVPADVEVAVAASAADEEGGRWRSEARFAAGPEGALDLGRVAPLSGSYDRADPLGLLWSMGPPKGEKDPRFRMPWDGFDVELEAVADGERASATVRRRFAAAGVERVDIEDRDLAAALFLPPAPGPRPGVAMFHGSGGGIAGLAPSGALLASHGFAALVVGYFGVPGRPQTLCEVPLESLAAGVERLRGHERVDGGRIAALGTSVGGEAALAMASYIDGLGLAAVVGIAPSSVVWQALADGRPPDKPRWTLGGRPLNYAPVKGGRVLWQILIQNPLRRALHRQPELHTAKAYEAGLRAPAAREAAIPVERIGAPLLLLAGEDDRVWPAAQMAQAVLARRGREHADRLVTYPHTGHISLRPPGVPTTVLRSGELAFGGTAAGFFDAMQAAWPEILRFLDASLSNAH
jgi:dienelactone hydrolase